MEFSIIIPTFKNYKYCKLTIDSIKKNSSYNHEVIVHVNGNDEHTENYLNKNNIFYTKSSDNIGLCSGVNLAAKKSSKNYILYSHDDMYFLPDWDKALIDEIRNLNSKNFYLSMTQISYMGPVKGSIQHIRFDCGETIEKFNEAKLLNEYRGLKFKNLQGSHWAPHLIHKNIWNKIGGFSEEFNPGFASDPDLNMKLWNEGVRIFKSVEKSRLYHFGSITTRKKENIIRNDGKKTFLKKWKITVDFFVKHYLKRGSEYMGPLQEPNRNIIYIIDFIIVKFKYFYLKVFK
tara:strand:+ start:693 stop:1559 length:867 start_codon:yes stop_codon:yes gene_type:complete